MRSFLSLVHLLFLTTLIPVVKCSPAKHIQEKRAITGGTPLFDLTHPQVPPGDYKERVLKVVDESTWDSDSVYWGSDRRSLASINTGHFVLSVQSNLGAWMCDVGSKMGSNIRSKDTKDYREIWLDGCRERLSQKLEEWERELQAVATSLKREDPIPLRIVGAQTFALRRGDSPLGAVYRPWIMPDMMQMFKNDASHPREVDIHQVSLFGWPALKSSRGEYGFAIMQDEFNAATGSSVIKIYSTGSGAIDPGSVTSPGYGMHTAMEIHLAGGVEIPSCQDWDYWVFNKHQKSTTTSKKPLLDAAIANPPRL